MARDLSADQKTNLTDNPFYIEKLLTINTPSGNFYYTTGEFNTEQDTQHGFGLQDYVADNGVEIVGNLNELYELNLNELQITIGDVSDTVYDAITQESAVSQYAYTNTNVYIDLLFRELSSGLGTAPKSTGVVIPVFDGSISKINGVRTATDFVLTLMITNKFAGLRSTNGRKTSNFSSATTDRVNWGNSSV